ncbi:unnamed protein product, partial [Symbiodinium necroappetens]
CKVITRSLCAANYAIWAASADGVVDKERRYDQVEVREEEEAAPSGSARYWKITEQKELRQKQWAQVEKDTIRAFAKQKQAYEAELAKLDRDYAEAMECGNLSVAQVKAIVVGMQAPPAQRELAEMEASEAWAAFWRQTGEPAPGASFLQEAMPALALQQPAAGQCLLTWVLDAWGQVLSSAFHIGALEDGVEVTGAALVEEALRVRSGPWPAPDSLDVIPSPMELRNALPSAKCGKACGPDALQRCAKEARTWMVLRDDVRIVQTRSGWRALAQRRPFHGTGIGIGVPPSYLKFASSSILSVGGAIEGKLNVGLEAGVLADAFASHVLSLSFGPRKTAARISLRGHGARGAAQLPVVDSYKHLGVIQAREGSVRPELQQGGCVGGSSGRLSIVPLPCMVLAREPIPMRLLGRGIPRLVFLADEDSFPEQLGRATLPSFTDIELPLQCLQAVQGIHFVVRVESAFLGRLASADIFCTLPTVGGSGGLFSFRRAPGRPKFMIVCPHLLWKGGLLAQCHEECDPATYSRGLLDAPEALECPTTDGVWGLVSDFIEPLDTPRTTLRIWQDRAGADPLVTDAAADAILMLDPELICDTFCRPKESSSVPICCGDLPGLLSAPFPFILTGEVRVFHLEAPPCPAFCYPFI